MAEVSSPNMRPAAPTRPVPSKAAEALRVCLRHAAHDWEAAPSPRSWGSLGVASQRLVVRECRSPHLRAVHGAAASLQLEELCLEPAVVAAVAAHPPCGTAVASSSQLRRRKEAAAKAFSSKAFSGPMSLEEVLNGSAGKGQPVSSALNLRRAISDGGRGVLRALLDAGLDVDATDCRGMSLLALACQGGHLAAAELLLARGATLHRLPLVLAAKEGHEALVRLLLDTAVHRSGCAEPASGRTTVCYYPKGDALLDRCFSAAERCRTSSPNAALCYASRAGRACTVRLLVTYGADPDLRSEKKTPLAHAAMAGHAQIVRLLLDMGVDPNATMQEHVGHSTALLHASQWGHVEAAKVLLDAGASTEVWSSSSQPPVAQPVMHMHVHKQFPQDRKNLSPLLAKAAAAMALGRCCPVEPVRAPPEPTMASPSHTPLMLAAKEGHFAMAELLLKRGAMVDAQNSAGRTALQLAATMQREAMVKLFLQHCAKVDIADAEGRTAADCARSGPCYDLLVAGQNSNGTQPLADTPGSEYTLGSQTETRTMDVTVIDVAPTLKLPTARQVVSDQPAVSSSPPRLRGALDVADNEDDSASECSEYCDDELEDMDIDDKEDQDLDKGRLSPLMHLIELGFAEARALSALEASGGNAQDAVELLMGRARN